MIRTAARDTDCALVRVLDDIVICAMSTSIEVTSNFISAVLRHHMMILLTLKVSHNTAFLRVDIDIVILIIQINIISYDKNDLSLDYKN